MNNKPYKPEPHQSTIIGSTITERRDNNMARATGANIVVNATAGFLTLQDVANAIILDTNALGNYQGRNYTGVDSDSITIGDTTHKKITIAGREWTNLGGATVKALDVAVVMTALQATVQYSTLTLSRAVTLPAASAVPAGYIVRVADLSGAATALVTVTIGPAGVDTIVGPAGVTAIINAAYDSRRLMSDGVSKWTIANGW